MSSSNALPFTTRIATWLLEHLTFGTHRDALSGDLLEELRAGRSKQWHQRQVLKAIGIELWARLRDHARPIVFSAGWNTLYPVWQFLAHGRLSQANADRWIALPWPYSSCAEIASGVAPAITFVWLGLILYLVAFPHKDRALSPVSLALGLSTSVSVLLVTTFAALQYLSHPGISLTDVGQQDFYLTFHLLTISIPLTLTLLSAILLALPRGPRLARTLRIPTASATKSTEHKAHHYLGFSLLPRRRAPQAI
ncbi:hypothetical protein [Granulicella sibirica]|uniref:Uncharacterized protein n=1 Tax=Granulicella sibirica TaxID=2479048 RepID=A0A4Q0T3J0_9BACT|nr:hypothetical protein [Granulicella sibirica]RXH57482.1 hypothetical protein GRAN_0792 [Granulicella sibirica]